MVNQYPDTIEWSEAATFNTLEKDANGDIVPPQGGTINFSVPGRAEAAGSGRRITSTGGVLIEYSWSLYFPELSSEIPEGTEVSVFRDGALRAKGTVKRCVINMFNARAWV